MLPTTDPKNESAEKNVPDWLRARSISVLGGGGTIAAAPESVYLDDLRRFRDPAKPKSRTLVRVTVREGSGFILLPGGHLVKGGTSEPLAMWPEELEALRTHHLASAADNAALVQAQVEFEFELAKMVKKLAINKVDPAWDQATAKEVVDYIAAGRYSAEFAAVLKEVRANIAESPQSQYGARNETEIKMVTAIEVLDPSLPPPAYSEEARNQAVQGPLVAAMSEGIALAMERQRVAADATATSTAQKGGKS